MQLPALSIQVNGSITLIDNLKVFGEQLTAFIGNVNKEPKDDQDFADLEAAGKTLQAAQDALEAAESSALAQTAGIDEMRRTVAMYKELARSNRLMFEKLVKAKKDSLRASIIGEGVMAYNTHFNALNIRIGKPYMPQEPRPDFAGAAKNKRTIASLRSAVDDELARAKIAANAIADGIQINVNELHRSQDYDFLFNDAATLVLKAPDDFALVVQSRISAHVAAVKQKEEQQREQIRAEEAARANLAAQQAQPAVILTQAPPRAAPPPIAAPAAWGGATKRPTDYQIIELLAEHYHVHESTVIGWLLELDLDAASERMGKEFAA